MTTSTVILSPAAAGQTQSSSAGAAALGDFEGKVVGFIDNAKPNFNHLVDAIAAVLTKEHGVERVVRRRKRAASIPAEQQALDQLAAECDLVIAGSGD